MLFSLDNDGVVTRFEGKGLEAIGLEPGEADGRSIWEIYGGYPDLLALVRDALEGKALSGTAELAAATFEFHFAPSYGPDGKRAGVIGVATDVTRQGRAERALRESEARKAAILQSALDAVISMDHEGRIVEFNPAAEKIFGYARSEAVGRSLADLIVPQGMRGRHREGLARYLSTGEGPNLGKRIEMLSMRADGTEFPVELTVIPFQGDGPPMFTAFIRDITDRKRGEEASSRLAAIVESSQDAIIGDDLNGTIVSWNAAAERIYGYTAKEAIGLPMTMLVPPERRGEFSEILDEVRRGVRVEPYETERLRKDGRRIDVSVTISPFRDAGGRIVGFSAIARDVTERKRAEEQVRHLAFHDNLTSLPNRMLFQDRLQLAVAQAHRVEQKLAVLFLDLDRFKTINDSLGHSAGDDLLRAVAERLTGCIREGDTVARLGGDEFIVLLPAIATEADGYKVGRKILEAVRRPFRIEDRELLITTSAGVAVYPTDGLDAQTLVSNADCAMYRVKASGRDGCQLFTPAGAARRFASGRRRRKG